MILVAHRQANLTSDSVGLGVALVPTNLQSMVVLKNRVACAKAQRIATTFPTKNYVTRLVIGQSLFGLTRQMKAQHKQDQSGRRVRKEDILVKYISFVLC